MTSECSDQSEQFVYVVDADNTVRLRPVETGGLALSLRIIREGLSAEDRVVVGGLQRVRPGMKVDPQTESIQPSEDELDVEDAEPEA